MGFFRARAVVLPVALRLRFVLEATRMLSTRLGYRRPARLAADFAFDLWDLVSFVWRLDLGADLPHVRFDVLGMDQC